MVGLDWSVLLLGEVGGGLVVDKSFLRSDSVMAHRCVRRG